MTDREIMQQALDALKNTATRSAAEQYATEQNAIAALEAALAQPEQEPVHFLANGVRYKVTHQGYYGCSIVGLPENLNGQWVALVEATDSKHLNCIAPQESTKPEQEPVAWQNLHLPDEFYDHRLLDPSWYSHYRPLYTAPQRKEWVGLTQEERDELLNGSTHIPSRLIDWVEQKLKEKNT